MTSRLPSQTSQIMLSSKEIDKLLINNYFIKHMKYCSAECGDNYMAKPLPYQEEIEYTRALDDQVGKMITKFKAIFKIWCI